MKINISLHLYSFFLLIYLCVSCSSYLKNFEVNHNTNTITNKLAPEQSQGPTYCPIQDITGQYQFLTNYKAEIHEYTHSIKTMIKKYSLKFPEASVLWTLVQFYLRPTSTAGNSRLQFFYTVNNESVYYDSEVHNDKRDIFTTLNLFLSHTKSHKKVSDIIGILEKEFPTKIKVDAILAQNLSAFSKQIENHKILKSSFIKGGQILKENETFDRRLYPWFLGHKTSTKVKNKNQTGYLFKKSYNTTEYLCSFDINIYENSLFPIVPMNKENPIYRHIFGISRNHQSFFAVTGLAVNKEDIHRQNPAPPAPTCLLKETDKTLFLISRKGRDPGQHLYHLTKYGIINANSALEIDEYLKLSRHLLLFNPHRILYESKRGNPPELKKYVDLNIPIYHMEHLGEVWVQAKFEASKSYFITDDRGQGVQSCQIE